MVHTSSAAIEVVAESSAELKDSPLSVTLTAPLIAMFERTAKLTVGLSKVNTALAVPTIADTVTPTRTEPPDVTGTRHCTVVPDVQPVLVHTSRSASELVGVSSTDPNSNPEIVTLSPPVGGPLPLAMPLTDGASNVKRVFLLPTPFPTDTVVTGAPPR